MRKVLVTGMSGTGKSTALMQLQQRGFQVVDTDEPPWTEWSDQDGGYVWREERIAELLARERGKMLEDRRLILSQLSAVEPLLRATCTHEIDATQPIPDVVDHLVDIGRGPNA